MILLSCFLFTRCISVEKNSLIISDISDLLNMNDFLKLGCTYFEFNNIVSPGSTDSNENIFLNLRNLKDKSVKRVFVFNSCDFSRSAYVVKQEQNSANEEIYNVDIILKNTKIGNGFAQTLLVNSVQFNECIIDLSILTTSKGVISANHVSFMNCRFVGELDTSRRSYPVLEYSYHNSQDIEMNDYSVEFIDCEFGLSENWKNHLYNNGEIRDDPGKQFIVIRTKSSDGNALKAVNIKFRRCYYSEGGFTGNLRLIKSVAVTDEDKSIISVVDDNNGINVDWCFSINDNFLDYDVGTWESIVTSVGYSPDTDPDGATAETATNSDDSSISDKNNNSNKSNTWMILAIVFIIACVALVVVLVVIVVLRKKNFDRSENENN